MASGPIAAARQVLEEAIAARVFPAASVEIGSAAGPIWQDALGTRSFDEPAAAASAETVFDLASLTKPIATTTVVMRLVDAGRLRLDELVEGSFGEWRGGDRERVSVRDLLEHASGLAARLVDPTGGNRREFEHEICRMPLEYAPRSRSVYSDLGFILLAFLAADRDERSLADQYANATSDPVFGSASDRLMFDVPPEARARTAPTTPADNDLRRGRRLVGEVHDNYAASLGGIAGHAGLFGTSAAVGSFARVVLRAARGDRSMPPPFTVDRVREFVTRSSVPDSSRALGWDTMLPTSSCGTRMSPSAFGHVGFTGTSLWIDPARDRYFVLLSNRAHRGGSLDQMREVRRAFHDALAEV